MDLSLSRLEPRSQSSGRPFAYVGESARDARAASLHGGSAPEGGLTSALGGMGRFIFLLKKGGSPSGSLPSLVAMSRQPIGCIRRPYASGRASGWKRTAMVATAQRWMFCFAQSSSVPWPKMPLSTAQAMASLAQSDTWSASL